MNRSPQAAPGQAASPAAAASAATDPLPPALDLREVGVLRAGRWILRDVNWSVPAGACAAILGPNGSGKSTLARILAGHLFPSRGDVRVLGGRFGQTDLAALRRDVRLLQPAGPYDVDGELTALDAVLTGFFGTLGLYRDVTSDMLADARRALLQVGLGHVADHPCSTLSSGERVRTLIARALVRRPRLLLLDEPTAGLDLLAREQVLATVQALFERRTAAAPADDPPAVILITHHVEELPPATSQVLLLSDGRPAATGAPADVLRPEVLSPVYGCPVQVRRSEGRFYLEVHPEAWRALLAASSPLDAPPPASNS